MKCASLLRRLAPSAVLFALLFSICLVPLAAQAVGINYGDFVGNSVVYQGVTEDSNTGDTLPLYGAPTVSGDSLDFNPVGFSAFATGAGGNDQTDGQLTFMVQALQGSSLQSIFISESGDTSLAGLGTDATGTLVRAFVFIDVLQVDFAPIDPINVVAALTFTPSSGDYFLGTDGGGGPSFQTVWTGSLLVDLAAVLAGNGIEGAATKISVNLDNRLTAFSEAGTSALIAKKDFDTSIVVDVPEPSAAGLVFAGLALAVARRRRLLRVR